MQGHIWFHTFPRNLVDKSPYCSIQQCCTERDEIQVVPRHLHQQPALSQAGGSECALTKGELNGQNGTMLPLCWARPGVAQTVTQHQGCFVRIWWASVDSDSHPCLRLTPRPKGRFDGSNRTVAAKPWTRLWQNEAGSLLETSEEWRSLCGDGMIYHQCQ